VTVYAAVGLDLQYARSSVAIVDGDEPGALPRIVGDGFREAIPNAACAGRWGSAAAERAIAHATADAASGSAADPWRPWLVEVTAPAFVQGLHERVGVYLGAYERGGRPVIAVVDDPVGPAVQQARAGALATVFGVEPVLVDPADALLHRHQLLADGRLPAGPVDVVAAGERWTVVRRYARDPVEPWGWRRAHPGVVLARGSQVWTDVLIGKVLRWSAEPDPRAALLAVEDGVAEFADALRGVERTEDVRWWGALGTEMSEPFALSWGELVRWPEVRSYLVDVAHAVVTVRSDDPRAAGCVLLGGPGAAWPFLAAEMPGQSTPPLVAARPIHDLAAGAAALARTAAQAAPQRFATVANVGTTGNGYARIDYGRG